MGLRALPAADPAELESHLERADICGFVLDGALWAGQPAARQATLLRRVAWYSSSAFLLIDATGLAVGSPAETVRSQRQVEPRASQLQIRRDATLTPWDAEPLAKAAAVVSPAARPRFVPADLTEEQSAAVGAAAAAYFAEEYARTGERLETLHFRGLAGGRSSARLLLLHFNARGAPAVAKLGDRDGIREEFLRFDTFIRRWDDQLRPFLHFHRKLGVIVFGLVEDAGRAGQPAPSLEDKFAELWQEEILPSEGVGVGDLRATAARLTGQAVRRVAQLNRGVPPAGAGLDSRMYCNGQALADQLRAGMGWRLPLPAGRDLAECIRRAEAVRERLDGRAVVHGDIHLRNILVPDDGSCRLIDYACAGPGHPAYDLVRLESALIFGHLRPLGTEDSFVELQRAVSVGRLAEPALRERFPEWFGSVVNEAVLRGALDARDACLEVLAKHGGGPEDYLAVKFLVACWSTAMPHLQLGLVRGTVRALGDAVG
jgi:hypothetical protein